MNRLFSCLVFIFHGVLNVIYFNLQLMENPQTVLLGKVVHANTDLINAYANKLEGSKIADQWRVLQQSVNVLFDSKTATSESSSLHICE